MPVYTVIIVITLNVIVCIGWVCGRVARGWLLTHVLQQGGCLAGVQHPPGLLQHWVLLLCQEGPLAPAAGCQSMMLGRKRGQKLLKRQQGAICSQKGLGCHYSWQPLA